MRRYFGSATAVLLFFLVHIGPVFASNGDVNEQSGCAPTFMDRVRNTANILSQRAIYDPRKTGVTRLTDYGIDPVFDAMDAALKSGKPISADEMFKLLVEERSNEACNCKPGIVQSATIRAINAGLDTLRSIWGGRISKEELFKRRFGFQLKKGTPDSAASVIKKVRRDFYAAFVKSLEADVKHAHAYREIFYLLQSVRPEDIKGSRILSLIKRSDELAARIHEVRDQKIDIEFNHKPETHPGQYVELVRMLENLVAELVEIRQQLKAYEGRVIQGYLQTTAEHIEGELLRLWNEKIKLHAESQKNLAAMYVKMKLLHILENLLEGDLKGTRGPVEDMALRTVEEVVREEELYLKHASVFGDYVKFVKEEASTATLIKRHNEIKKAAQRWMDLWDGRVLMIEPRIEFNYQIASIGLEVGRLIANNTITAQFDNVKKILQFGWNHSVGPLAEKIKERALPRVVSPVERAQVAVFRPAMIAVAEHIRGNKPLDRHELRAHYALMHAYLLDRLTENQKFDPEVHAVLLSAEAADVKEHVYQQTQENLTDGEPIDLLVADQIFAAQLAALDRYDNLKPAIAENISLWIITYKSLTSVGQWIAHHGAEWYNYYF